MPSFHIEAVEQPHVAFDHREVAVSGMTVELTNNLTLVLYIGIKIQTGAPGGGGQPHGIDVIGAFFEWLNTQATLSQSRTQSEGDRGLPRGFVRGSQQQTRYH